MSNVLLLLLCSKLASDRPGYYTTGLDNRIRVLKVADPKNYHYSPKTHRRPSPAWYTPQELREAIARHESYGGRVLRGDTGKAFGHMHMHRGYAKDAGLNMKTWKTDVNNRAIADRAFRNYNYKYNKKFLPKRPEYYDNYYLSPAVVKRIIRMHNGGPNAMDTLDKAKLRALDIYENRVRKELQHIPFFMPTAPQPSIIDRVKNKYNIYKNRIVEYINSLRGE